MLTDVAIVTECLPKKTMIPYIIFTVRGALCLHISIRIEHFRYKDAFQY